MRILILTCLLLVSCGVLPHRREDKQLSRLDEMAAVYRGLQTPGWVNTDECDALLFNSLRAAAGISIPIAQAQDSDIPGRWYRRPVSLPECYSTGGSLSTISRDMLLGLYWYLWTERDATNVANLWNYGASRNWVMGDDGAAGFHTILNPNMIALLGRLCVNLSAPCQGNYVSWSQVPLTFFYGISEGFTRHLTVLQILLLGEMEGQLPGYLVDELRLHAVEQPRNPLYAAAVLLYDRSWSSTEVDRRLESWPVDRLPTSADWCSSWRVEAEGPGPITPDGSRGWNPCPENDQVHSGGEILFIQRILRGRDP